MNYITQLMLPNEWPLNVNQITSVKNLLINKMQSVKIFERNYFVQELFYENAMNAVHKKKYKG